MRLERMRGARSSDARRWTALPITGAFAWLATSACGTSTTACDCLDTAIVVHVPDAIASSVIDVTPSGAACANAKPTCTLNATSGGCTSYRIAPTIDGTCHIDVDFSMGGPRFSADARVVHASGCCGGFVTDPPSASNIDVPGAVASHDAGGGG